MPDSQQPPFWGPADHERDLDALLSGTAGSIPPALRPVESTLAALRAAPNRRELSNEAAARAAFRALAAPQAPWTAAAEHGTVNSDTLVLPLGEHVLPPADRRPPRAARHRRRRRRASEGRRRSAIALTSVAVVAVVAIAVAATGALPGSIGQMVSFGSHPTSAASSPAPAGQKPGSLDGSGHASRQSPRRPPTAAPSASPSATTDPSALCHEFLDFSRPRNQTMKPEDSEALTRLAGGPDKVSGYCFHLLWPSAAFPTQRPFAYSSFGDFPGGPGGRGRDYPGAIAPGVTTAR